MKIKRTFLLIVIFFATLLLLLAFWAIRRNSGSFSNSLVVYNVVVSTELDDKSNLMEVVSRFSYGARQVYLRFEYSKIEEEGEVIILWHMGEKLVQSDVYSLPGPSGTKVYSLVRENGQPLPRGTYAVTMLNGPKPLLNSTFEIK
ncbi:MAG: hypothetical protein LBC93_02395 [Synergistaceae bacterium]|jgi:hypothetical protein|nr:hypothetical protein [Synergistaceae bacterium]